MKISVIIPTYNRVDYLIRTVTSVLSQEFPADEIIIIDDGSDDDTERRVNDLFGARVRYFKQSNSGQMVARYNGIGMANNDWIALCDSDDLWSPKHLSDFVATVERASECDVYFSNFSYIDAVGVESNESKFDEAPEGWLERIVEREVLPGRLAVCKNDFYKDLLEFQPVFQSSFIFSKALYENIGGLATSLGNINSEDAHLMRRLVAYGRVGFSFGKNVKIRKHAGNFSDSYLKNCEGRLEILQRLCSEKEIPEEFIPATEMEIVSGKRHLFSLYVWNNLFREACVIYRETPKNAFIFTEHIKYIYSCLRCFFSK